MDTSDIIARAKLNASYAEQKIILLAKFDQNTIVAHNGGLFKITPELLSYLNWKSKTMANCVVMDSQHNPITIQDLPRIVEDWNQQYVEAINSLHASLTALKKCRTPAQLVAQSS